MSGIDIQSIIWKKDHARIIDQTFLPRRKVYDDIRDMGSMWKAIKKLRIRGAGVIGIAGGYGFYLGIKDLPEMNIESFWVETERISDYLLSARPEAANLKWALQRITRTMRAHRDEPISQIKEIALETVITIHDEEKRICKKIGKNGATLVKKGENILTLGNTGSLATGKYGTALSVISQAHEMDKNINVWVCETRPLMQQGC